MCIFSCYCPWGFAIILILFSLQAVAEISKASKREACSLPTQAESYLLDVKARISDIEKKDDDDIIMSQVESGEQFSVPMLFILIGVGIVFFIPF